MTRALMTLSMAAGLVGASLLPASAADLREAVPTDVFLAIYHKHNPERDYQKAYFEDVWRTVEDTQIVERTLKAIENAIPEDDREEFDNVRETLSEALDPVQWDALAECTESVYAQRMAVPTAQHLLLMRLPEGAAASCVAATTNLFKLAESASNGRAWVSTETAGDVTLTLLMLPNEVPFRPCVAAAGDVYVFGSSREFVREGLLLLNNPSAESKFDDERVTQALAQLPEVEDGLVFFDGKALFRQLGGFAPFIRQVSQGDPEAERIVRLVESALGQFDGIDFEITVEYTEGHQNRTAALGRVTPDVTEKLLGKMFGDQQPFTDWSRWVPKDATRYALSSGVNLHPLYVWLMDVIPEHFPESQEALDAFDDAQKQFDVHLDEDLLQAFSGESISISLPGANPTPFGNAGRSVTLMRCTKQDRVKELLHRLVDQLKQIPQLDAQNISLEPVDGMEGFEELSAGIFGMIGIRPVIGFNEDWLVIGSHAEAVQAVLDTRAGDAPSIVESEAFQTFDVEVTGPVTAISYRSIGEGIRSFAQGLQTFGAMLPMFMGMAGQNTADLQPAQEFLALLPTLGQIVAKFDFYDAQLSWTQPGPDPLTYRKQSVTLIRPPTEEAK